MADGIPQLLQVLVDDAEGARVAELAVKSVRASGIERGERKEGMDNSYKGTGDTTPSLSLRPTRARFCES
jgi:hypothetical protein